MPINKNVMHFLAQTHAFWYRATGGVIGAKVSGMPVLLLTTTGRKSGRKRTTPLTHQRDGDNYVVIASNGGHDNHPTWYLNLRSNPDVEVVIGGEKMHAHAEIANDANRERLYKQAVDIFPGYAEYQAQTKRKIPVVVLRRVPRPAEPAPA